MSMSDYNRCLLSIIPGRLGVTLFSFISCGSCFMVAKPMLFMDRSSPIRHFVSFYSIKYSLAWTTV